MAAIPSQRYYVRSVERRIQEQAAAGGRGTVGLSDTLEALNEQRVHILLVQDGYTQPGYECPNCGLLMPEEPGPVPVTCPACDSPINRVGNVVDSGIQRGFELGANVEVSTERDQLQPIAYFPSITYY